MYQPRTIRFIRREDVGDWRLKVYGIGTMLRTPDPSSSRRHWGRPAALPSEGGAGFVIAHDACGRTGARLLVGQRERDPRTLLRVAADDPTALVLNDGTGLACVWELEVLDFERRAWLEDVLKNDDVEAYLSRSAPDTEI